MNIVCNRASVTPLYQISWLSSGVFSTSFLRAFSQFPSSFSVSLGSSFLPSSPASARLFWRLVDWRRPFLDLLEDDELSPASRTMSSRLHLVVRHMPFFREMRGQSGCCPTSI